MHETDCVCDEIFEYVPLAPRTTYRIGGPARYFLSARAPEDIVWAQRWAAERSLPWFLLGNGSNILVDDAGFPGLVIQLDKEFDDVRLDCGASRVTVGAATPLPRLGRQLARAGIPGFEFMVGIPGTVGAAVRINAGTANEGEIKDVLHAARLLSPEGDVREFGVQDLGLGYRHSRLCEERQWIVLEASFRVPRWREPAEDISARLTRMLERRRSKQPRNPRNCGSVFKTPSTGKSAGWYIEQAGLKGQRVGGAQVAPEHANWIVNLGGASAADVKALISLVQARVSDAYDVRLERELVFVPGDQVCGYKFS